MKISFRFFTLSILIMSFVSGTVRGQDARRPLKPNVSITELEPVSSDERFVGTTGGDYDNYLFREDRSDGLLNYTVDITRYYSNLMKFDNDGFLTNAQELISKGLIPPSVRMTMRIYDVDHNSQYDGNFDGVADPEIDYVYVNKKLVKTGSGQTWTLGSGNNIWSLAAINIPIEYLKFPTKPGTAATPPNARNLIQIEIDVNQTGYWAVQCDWISFEIESKIRPLVLIRGYSVEERGTAASALEVWDVFGGFLKEDGIPYHVAESIDACGSILNNGLRINEEVRSAKSIFGVEKVNLVGYSKGGLDSRSYLRNWSDAENLVQLGTPNHGSGLAYLPGICDEGALNLMPSWLANNFNYSNQDITQKLYLPEREKGTNIYLIIGRSDWFVSAERATLPWNATYKNNDLTSPQISVANDFAEAGHLNLPKNHDAYKKAIFQINEKIKTSPLRTRSNFEVASPESIPDSLKILLIDNSQISGLATKKAKSYLPITGLSYFRGFFPNGIGEFTLKSPAGKIYNASSPEYKTDGTIIVYQIQNAEKGNWDVNLKGPAANVRYEVRSFGQSDKNISVKPDKSKYLANEPVTMSATLLTNGKPVLSGKGMAYFISSTKVDSMELFDDGQHFDIKANDGIYGNRFTGFKEKGFYPVIIKVQHQLETVFKDDLITVYSKNAELTNIYKESVIDKDRDNLSDSLQIRVGVKVTQAGNFLLTGVLKDAQNKVIVSGSWINTGGKTIPPGNYEWPLNFSGEAIAKNGVNGPYTLAEVNLVDAGSSVIIDTKANPYKTLTYNVATFSQPLIALTGKNTETAIDSDGDGDIDFLDIKIQLKVLKAGNYTTSAELTDSLQNSLNWADKTVFLSAGLNDLTLRFDGQEINEKLANGPYVLTNLYLQGSPSSASFFNVFRTKAYVFSNFTGNILAGLVKDRISGKVLNDATLLLKGTKLVTAKTDSKGLFTIAGLPNGDYTLQITKNNYCNSEVLTISKLQGNRNFDLLITPSTITLETPKNVSLCKGDSLTISAPAGWTSYKWSNNTTTASLKIKNEGSYFLKTKFQTCEATSDTIMVKVFDYPKPMITSSTGQTSILSNEQLVLTTGTANNQIYQWKKDGKDIDNAKTATFIANQAGKYTVAVSANGCLAISPVFEVMIILTNEQTKIEDFALSIFPNPSQSEVEVEIHSLRPQRMRVQLIDFAGKVLLTQDLESQAGKNVFKLDLKNIQGNTSYIIQVNDGKTKHSKKLVLE